MNDLTDNELDQAERTHRLTQRDMAKFRPRGVDEPDDYVLRLIAEVKRSRPLVAAALAWGEWFTADGDENAPEQLEDAIHVYEDTMAVTSNDRGLIDELLARQEKLI